MKRCPYCAEEIQDAALKCRWCGSDLTVAPDKVVASPPPELSRAHDPSPSPQPEPTPQPEPLPQPEPVPQPGPGPSPQPEPGPQPQPPEPIPQPPSAQASAPPIREATTPSSTPGLTFSHEGPRYLLGYTAEYFGVWDKRAPGPPTQRFPRTEAGWQDAWAAFVRAEMAAAGA